MRTELPPIIAVAPAALVLCAVVLPPFPGRALVFLPPIAFFTIYAPLRFTTGSPGSDFGLATNAYLIFLAWDRLTSKESDFRRKGKRKDEEGQGRISRGWRRLGWALKLLVSMRGADWSWEVTHTPPATIRNRIPFLLDRCVRVPLLYLFLDALGTFMHPHRYFARQISYDRLAFHEKLLCSLAGAAAGCGAISLLYNIVCSVGVASFAFSPAECPDLFGCLEPSIAGFWGKTWHQSFRRTFGGAGIAVSRSLGLSPQSPLNRYVTTMVAFACSGLLHSFAVHCMRLRGGLWTFLFFAIQPVGMAGEALASRCVGARRSNSVGLSLLGYLWTLSWLLATFSPSFLDELVVGGMWEVNLTPYSIVQGGVWV